MIEKKKNTCEIILQIPYHYARHHMRRSQAKTKGQRGSYQVKSKKTRQFYIA